MEGWSHVAMTSAGCCRDCRFRLSFLSSFVGNVVRVVASPCGAACCTLIVLRATLQVCLRVRPRPNRADWQGKNLMPLPDTWRHHNSIERFRDDLMRRPLPRRPHPVPLLALVRHNTSRHVTQVQLRKKIPFAGVVEALTFIPGQSTFIVSVRTWPNLPSTRQPSITLLPSPSHRHHR